MASEDMVELVSPELEDILSVDQVADILGVSSPRVHQIAPLGEQEARAKRKAGGHRKPRNKWTLGKALQRADKRIKMVNHAIESSVEAMLAISKEGRLLAMNRAAERLLFVAREAVVGMDLREAGGVPGDAPQGSSFTYRRGRWRQEERLVWRVAGVDAPDFNRASEKDLAALPADQRREAERLCAETTKRHGRPFAISVQPGIYPELGGGEIELWVHKRQVTEGHNAYSVLTLNPRSVEDELIEIMSRLEGDPAAAEHALLEAAKTVANTLATRCMAESCSVFLHRLPADDVRRKATTDMSTQVVVTYCSEGLPAGMVEREHYVIPEEGPSVVGASMHDREAIAMAWRNPEDEDLSVVRLPNYANLKLNSRFGTLQTALVVPIHLTSGPYGLRFGAIRLTNFYHPKAPGGDGTTDAPDFVLRTRVPVWVQVLADRLAKYLALMYRRVLQGAQFEAMCQVLESVQRWRKIEDYAEEVVRVLQSQLEFEQVAVWRNDAHGFTRVASCHSREVVKKEDVPDPWSAPESAVAALRAISISRDEGERRGAFGFEVPIRCALRPTEVWGTLGLYNSWLLYEGHDATKKELMRLAEDVATAMGGHVPPSDLKAKQGK